MTTYDYQARRLRQPVRFLANAGVVGFDRVVLDRVLGNDRPNLRPDHRARLREIYAPDLDLLASLIGRDLTSWGGDPSPAEP
ncbi:MAG: hypothetical protein M3011_03505 [Actinomycetota bacterium]|nr:hypothetical protein [Actinomycetota bacterium]